MLFSGLVFCNPQLRTAFKKLKTARFNMKSAQLLSELSKFSADMRLADSYIYFDNIIITKNRIIFDHRGDQNSITIGEAIELLAQHASKSVWFMSDSSEIPIDSIKKAEFEGESYIKFQCDCY